MDIDETFADLVSAGAQAEEVRRRLRNLGHLISNGRFLADIRTDQSTDRYDALGGHVSQCLLGQQGDGTF